VNWLIRVLLVSCLLISPPPSSGQTLKAVLEEPNFNQVKEWVLHFALGIVASFYTKEGMIYFSYPILDERPVKMCIPYARVGDEMHLVDNGRLYVVKAQPTLFRHEYEDWKMWDELRQQFEE